MVFLNSGIEKSRLWNSSLLEGYGHCLMSIPPPKGSISVVNEMSDATIKEACLLFP